MMRVRQWARDALGIGSQILPVDKHLDAAMAWLCHGQDSVGGRGVARSYSLRWNRAHNKRGWLAAYPETTGYIIPTFFDYAAFSGEPGYRDRAIRMAEWEAEIQLPNGAVQGGTVAFPPTPAVFNTGQVLFGWARAFVETGDKRFRDAAGCAADFLVSAQDSDGAWRREGSKYARVGVNVYDARTAWGLIDASRITANPAHRQAAIRNLEFVLSQQYSNGWFPDCCLDDDKRPLLHTIAYTIEGLLEAGALLGEPRFGEAARRPLDVLLSLQRDDGSLAGRFDCNWKPAARWTCLTGDAQVALCWLRFFQLTGKKEYLEAARRMNRFLITTQDLTSTDLGVRGGIKGSHPIWGAYSPYEYPNWAAKFFVDSLLMEVKLTKHTTETRSMSRRDADNSVGRDRRNRWSWTMNNGNPSTKFVIEELRAVALWVVIFACLLWAYCLVEAAATSFPANTWVVLHAGSQEPGFRGWQQVSYDREFKEVVLFGGSAATYMSDTWTYSLGENLWHLRRSHPDLTGPCRRDMHNLVYDPVAKMHWLLNGISYDNLQPGCPGKETRAGIWNYDRARNIWIKLSEVSNINQRLAPGLAYNPDDRSFLQFGGSKTNSTNATFRFDIDRRAWTQLKPSTPLPRERINIENGLVYDKAHKMFVLFGGKGAGMQGDTWTFDPRASAWREMKTEVSPPARDLAAMVYDEVNRVTILFGGRDSRGKPLNDTWVYDGGGNTWNQLTNIGEPAALAHHSGVYVPEHNIVIVTTGHETRVFKYVPSAVR
jgi:hypothetical protein